MTTPNFFLVGAAKSGTTTLYDALREHEDIFLPAVKEPHFFAYLADPQAMDGLYADEDVARRIYGDLYRDVAGEAAVGDASNSSLVVAGTARAIARDTSAARIVAILRHPVDRAFSHYRYFRAAGAEEIDDFGQAVRAEGERRTAGFPLTYQYLGWGDYARQLRPFFDLFGEDRVLVHLYDDLCSDSKTMLRATFRFLGVDDGVPLAAFGRSNAGGAPRSRAESTLRRRARRLVSRQRAPELDPDLRAELTEGLAVEISQLEELLGRDLSAWR